MGKHDLQRFLPSASRVLLRRRIGCLNRVAYAFSAGRDAHIPHLVGLIQCERMRELQTLDSLEGKRCRPYTLSLTRYVYVSAAIPAF